MPKHIKLLTNSPGHNSTHKLLDLVGCWLQKLCIAISFSFSDGPLVIYLDMYEC